MKPSGEKLPQPFSATIREERGEDGSIILVGPWRSPSNLLKGQSYADHASIHDDSTAQGLGFRGGTIEGPTHFSQFAPLLQRAFGVAWFEFGSISSNCAMYSFCSLTCCFSLAFSLSDAFSTSASLLFNI